MAVGRSEHSVTAEGSPMAYYTYLLRCLDGSLYGGIAADLSRRMGEHFRGDGRCAKYTKTHPPKTLCAAWESENRATASRLEYRIKHLPKPRKEELALCRQLDRFFESSFSSSYRPLSPEECSACVSHGVE